MDLYNLDTGTKTVVASTSDGRTLFMQPTLSGQTVVWVRVTEPVGPDINPLYDLVLLQLGSHHIVNLTHNTRHPYSGVSIEPSLWRHYLLFKQSGSPYLVGDIFLWDLSSGYFPLWYKRGEVALEYPTGEMPRWNGEIAWRQAEGQATDAVYLPGTGTVWTFQYGPHTEMPTYYQYDWAIFAAGGRNIVVQRTRSGRGGLAAQPTYFVWHFPPAKGWLCR